MLTQEPGKAARPDGFVSKEEVEDSGLGGKQSAGGRTHGSRSKQAYVSKDSRTRVDSAWFIRHESF